MEQPEDERRDELVGIVRERSASGQAAAFERDLVEHLVEDDARAVIALIQTSIAPAEALMSRSCGATVPESAA